MRTIKFKEVIKMKDLQAPYITDAEIYGVDSGRRNTTPHIAECAYCESKLYEGDDVLSLVYDDEKIRFCENWCMHSFFDDVCRKEML